MGTLKRLDVLEDDLYRDASIDVLLIRPKKETTIQVQINFVCFSGNSNVYFLALFRLIWILALFHPRIRWMSFLRYRKSYWVH